jgi:hypothetical protein
LNTIKRIQVVKSLVPWRIVESNLHKCKGYYQGTGTVEISSFNVLTGCLEQSLTSHLELMRYGETSFCSQSLLPNEQETSEARNRLSENLLGESNLRIYSSCSQIELSFKYKKLIKTQKFLLCAQNFHRSKRSDTYYCYLVMKNKVTVKLYFLPVFAPQTAASRDRSPQYRPEDMEPNSNQQPASPQSQACESLSDSIKSTPKKQDMLYLAACALQVRIGPEIKDLSSISKGGFVSSVKKAHYSDTVQNIRLNIARPNYDEICHPDLQTVEQPSSHKSCAAARAGVPGEPVRLNILPVLRPIIYETSIPDPVTEPKGRYNFSKKFEPSYQKTAGTLEASPVEMQRAGETEPSRPDSSQSQYLVSTEARIDFIRRDGRKEIHHFLLKPQKSLHGANNSGPNETERPAPQSSETPTNYTEIRKWSVQQHSSEPGRLAGSTRIAPASSLKRSLISSSPESKSSGNRPKPQIDAMPEHVTPRFV